MKKSFLELDDLVEGQEYYFYFSSWLCTGFFVRCKKNMIYLNNGCFWYMVPDVKNEKSEITFCFDNGIIDREEVIGFATT